MPVEEEDYQQGDLFQQTQQVGGKPHVFIFTYPRCSQGCFVSDLDPDPPGSALFFEAESRIRIRVKSLIRIRIRIYVKVQKL